ncbi:hypothetical protein YC2023_048923 [Brassica napus]
MDFVIEFAISSVSTSIDIYLVSITLASGSLRSRKDILMGFKLLNQMTYLKILLIIVAAPTFEDVSLQCCCCLIGRCLHHLSPPRTYYPGKGQNSVIHGSIPVRVNHYHHRYNRGSIVKAARLCTSQAELKDGTTRAPIVWFLSCQRATELKPSLENPDHFETPAVIFNRYHQDVNFFMFVVWFDSRLKLLLRK